MQRQQDLLKYKLHDSTERTNKRRISHQSRFKSLGVYPIVHLNKRKLPVRKVPYEQINLYREPEETLFNARPFHNTYRFDEQTNKLDKNSDKQIFPNVNVQDALTERPRKDFTRWKFNTPNTHTGYERTEDDQTLRNAQKQSVLFTTKIPENKSQLNCNSYSTDSLPPQFSTKSNVIKHNNWYKSIMKIFE